MDPASTFREVEKTQSALSYRSYVVAFSLWEQLLGATQSFAQLQCWAKNLGKKSSVSVVEPYLKINRSNLGFSIAQSSTLFSNISLSSVYDMDTWDTLWPNDGGSLAPIVSKDTFLNEVTRFEKNVTLIQFKYLNTNKKVCDFSWNIGTLMEDLEHYRLTVTRKVCINLLKLIKSDDFKNLIIGDVGDHSVQNTVFIFKEWRGIGGSSRTNINLYSCMKEVKHDRVHPSEEVLRDAESYAQRYLGGFGQYVSVHARFEKVSLHYSTLSMKQKRHEVELAIAESMVKISGLKKKGSVKTVYLTYDYGQFGSRTFELGKFYNSSDLLIKFQEDLYEGRMSPSEYEQSFMTFRYRNPGYIAMVQMTISSRGRCLLRLGWGYSIHFGVAVFKANHARPFCYDCVPYNICKNLKKW